MKRGWMAAAAAAVSLCMAGCGTEQQPVTQATTSAATSTVITTEAPKQSIKSDAEKLALEVSRCKQELEAAEKELNTRKQEYTDAEKVYTDAKNALDNYNSEHADIVPQIGKGTLGFFEYVGAEAAVEVLKNAEHASSTQIGDPNDATSLDNMRATFPHLRTCNILRDDAEVSDLRITDRLMAIAESNLNWTDEHLESSGQFDVEENFAAGYENPYYIWYDKERDSEGEHYRRVVGDSYALTGFAYCTAKRSGQYDFSHCQVFTGKSDEESFTIDEYEERFTKFYNAVTLAADEVKELTAEMNAAKEKADEFKKTYEDAETAYQTANENYQKAESIYNWYT
ncbi:MAG: hypothetical protein IK130_08395 [Oscillospiraceae bacterium]|nr:hypothetical protein [Oscillospiraceae bacterium]